MVFCSTCNKVLGRRRRVYVFCHGRVVSEDEVEPIFDDETEVTCIDCWNAQDDVGDSSQ